MFNYQKAFTHGGLFHADDVFSSAFLKLLNPDIKIERGFSVPNDYDGLVFDIGGGKFDHHDIVKELRSDSNRTPYAAFGKLWREFATELVSEYVQKRLDEDYIFDLDKSDNNGDFNAMSVAIYNMNGLWNEDNSPESQYVRFMNAVEFAKGVLQRYIDKLNSEERAREEVLSAYEKSENGIVILERYAPWEDTLRNKGVKVVVYPSLRGGYNAERVKNSGFEFKEAWKGTRNNKNVDGLLFCHSSGFLANFDTLENTLKGISVCL